MIFNSSIVQYILKVFTCCRCPKKKLKQTKQSAELLLNNNMNNNSPNLNQNYFIYHVNNIKVKASQNELLFYLNESTNQQGIKTNLYYHFKIEYDQDFNPKFHCYIGEMKNQLRHGQGISCYAKSEYVEYNGKWYHGQKEQKQKVVQQQCVQSSNFSKRIIIRENGVIVNNPSKRTIYDSTSSTEYWIKFNQQLSPLDLRILQNQQTYFTSSIIDAYASYLTINNELEFFKQINKANFQRQLFLPSSLFTNMWQNNDSFNITIFHNYLLEYKYIDYQILDIYQKIYFVINQEFHWYLVKIMKVKFNNEYIYIIEIFDSIKHYENYYQKMLKILLNLFPFKKKVQIFYNFKYLQKNSYDCGPWTCLNMKLEYLYQISISKCIDRNVNVEAIKLELFNLLKKT